MIWALASMLKGDFKQLFGKGLPTAHLAEFDLGYAKRAKVSYN